MVALIGNFFFILAAIAIIAELIRPGSNTKPVIDSTSNLISSSIKAAKS